MTYKGFIGSVHFSADDKVFHGKIEGIDDIVTFEGNTADGLVKAFHEEVDDYVELCKARLATTRAFEIPIRILPVRGLL